MYSMLQREKGEIFIVGFFNFDCGSVSAHLSLAHFEIAISDPFPHHDVPH